MDKEYKEYIREFQTEVGLVEIIHMYDGTNTEIEVWVNKSRMYMPDSVLKQTSQTIIKKVVKAVKTGQKLGLNKGVYNG